ncbi:HVSL domain-containing protein [Aspergillus lucknowensis]|uniref:U6 snRNA phosphodiesterase n=1 Tax=Aspergillus lucknowensis TaxID=176173 RepID=A0ABR4LZT6_9EURO
MALVQYSESESDAEQESPPREVNKTDRVAAGQTRQCPSLPPLPPAFHDLYASSIRVSVRDDPSLHGGRKRVIPHVEGNWPTHIYLEWYPSKDELEILCGIIAQTGHMLREEQSSIHSLLHSDLGAQLPLHISLSRPVVLRTEERQPFLDMFQTALQASDISPFDIQMEGLDWVSNSEKTRWFYVVRVNRPNQDTLNRLLRISNRSLDHFGQPSLYETPDPPESHTQRNYPDTPKDYTDCFHISIAWRLAEPSTEDRERIKSIDLEELSAFRIHFNSVKAKIGNHVSSIQLAS